MTRSAFRVGLELLADKQHELGKPPKRSKINHMVESIVKEAGLEEDTRRRSFTLLAICALMGRDSMHFNFKSRR